MKFNVVKRHIYKAVLRGLSAASAVLVLAGGFVLASPALPDQIGLGSIVYAQGANDDDKPQPAPQLPPITIKNECPQGQCIIDKYINPAIKAVSAMVGIGVTVSIIYAGIQMSSSANNPQKVSAARQRIATSFFVLVGYFVFLAFLNWVIPGGIT